MLGELIAATKTLRRQPAFALAAAGTLALGIAASTAVFSTVNAALLRPLPFPAAGDIYSLRTRMADGRYTSGLVASAELISLKTASPNVTHAAFARRINLTANTAAGALDAVTYAVSGDFLPLFGARMALGRAFTPDEHARAAARSVVVSHRAWQQYFGGDPDIVGKHIQFSLFSAPIVGVAPRDFDVPAGTEFWVNAYEFPGDIGHTNYGYIRLKRGVTIEALAGPMTTVMDELGVRFPDQNQGRLFVATKMRDSIVGDLGPVLLILFGATGLLLLTAGVNVANLMLARGTARAREMAVRAALGATRWTLARHLLAESVVIACAGGAAGIAAAFGAVRLLHAFGASKLPLLDAVPFDPAVVAFATATVVVTGIGVGVAPAFVTARTDVSAVMNEGGRSAMGGPLTRRLLGCMVVAQIALAIALVGGAARLVRSFENLAGEERGFTTDPRLVIDVNLPFLAFRERAQVASWLSDAESRLRAIGATEVAAVSTLPLRPELDTTTFVDIVNDPNIPARNRPNARLRFITPDFLDVMGIRLVAGRPYSEQDRDGTQPVILINESFARRFLKGRDPLREQLIVPGFWMMERDGKRTFQPAHVIGVVADTRYTALGLPPEQTVYLAMAQAPLHRMSLVLRSEGRDVETLELAAREALKQLDPRVPVESSSMQAAVDASLSRQRLGMILMSAFGLAALALAAVGVFGVVAFVVSQRTGEMAVRLAIGASTRQVFWLVMRQGAALVAIGSVMGLLLSWWTGGMMSAYVYEVRSLDPMIIGTSLAAVAIVATGATAILAGRASRVSPSRALRTGT